MTIQGTILSTAGLVAAIREHLDAGHRFETTDDGAALRCSCGFMAACPVRPLSPWKPERDPVRLAVLGKLLEELGECSAIVSRCLIQGVDGSRA